MPAIRVLLLPLIFLNLCMASVPEDAPPFSNQSMDRLTSLLGLPSSSGREGPLQQFWLKHIAPLADSSGTDAHQNAWATFRSPDPDAPELLIDAHADEVGVVIADITPNGFLKVKPIGFPDFQSMLSCPYRFDGAHGPVTAFAGAVPGWWLNRTPLPAGTEYVLFDVGASSAEEARNMGLSTGQRGVPATRPELLHGSRLMAHGLDCRLNSFMLTELAFFLSQHQKDLKYHVTLLSSSQEEIGLIGATAYCEKNRPKLAIVIDCTLDTVQLDDLPSREENGRLTRQAMGKGPVLFTHDKIFYQPITAQLLQLAEEHGIPLQKDATFPPGMANFVPVKLYGGQAAFLGPPIRYMHSPRELADLKDVKATLDLLGRFLCTPPSPEVKAASAQEKKQPSQPEPVTAR